MGAGFLLPPCGAEGLNSWLSGLAASTFTSSAILMALVNLILATFSLHVHPTGIPAECLIFIFSVFDSLLRFPCYLSVICAQKNVAKLQNPGESSLCSLTPWCTVFPWILGQLKIPFSSSFAGFSHVATMSLAGWGGSFSIGAASGYFLSSFLPFISDGLSVCHHYLSIFIHL